MSKARKWNDEELRSAVIKSSSLREVIYSVGLVPAGGNYEQIKRAIKSLALDTGHFTGKGWRKNRTFAFTPRKELSEILVKNSHFQSHKLKQRLFREKIKTPACEICDWAEKAEDGRIPLELDHVNGDRYDNRINNLRILCPNCHSLQATHRGKKQNRHRNR